MDDPLVERVLNFTARHIPSARGRISLDSRLLQDLGLDGEDALEFFEAYDTEFEVDLTLLIKQNWRKHFGPQGGVSWIAVAGFFVCYLVAAALERVTAWPPQWIWYLAAILVWALVLRFLPLYPSERELVPITVRDLVDAAKSGVWSKAA